MTYHAQPGYRAVMTRMRRYYSVVLGGIVALLLLVGGDHYIAVRTCSTGGTTHLLLQALSPSGRPPDNATMARTRQIVADRVNGVTGGFNLFSSCQPDVRVVTKGAARYISVAWPGLASLDIPAAKQMLQTTGRLSLVALGARPLPFGALVKGYRVLAWSSEVITREVVLGQNNTGAPAVDAIVGGRAVSALATYTARHVGGYLGIVLDGRLYQSARIVQALPAGNVQIIRQNPFDVHKSSFSFIDAKDFVAALRNGPLPVRLKVTQVSVQP